VIDLNTNQVITLADIFASENDYRLAVESGIERGNFRHMEMIPEVYSGTFDDKLPFRFNADGVVLMFNPIIGDSKLIELTIPYDQTKLDVLLEGQK